LLFDKIENIELYKGLSADIYAGLKYLKDMTPDVEPGVYEINPRVKAIVSEYTTKPVNENGYEAHQKNIDIQYLLKGTEKISCLPVDELQETKPYNPSTDAAFYAAPRHLSPVNCPLDPVALHLQVKELSTVNCHLPSDLLLGNGYFTIFFPHDAHMPKLCIDAPEEVKKVIIKVKIS
jgi:YhcH/YjgK/YiaL family protein